MLLSISFLFELEDSGKIHCVEDDDIDRGGQNVCITWYVFLNWDVYCWYLVSTLGTWVLSHECHASPQKTDSRQKLKSHAEGFTFSELHELKPLNPTKFEGAKGITDYQRCIKDLPRNIIILSLF